MGRRILFGIEGGAGWGHGALLQPISGWLRRRGHLLSFAATQNHHESLCGLHSVTSVELVPTAEVRHARRCRNHADLLYNAGMGDFDYLSGRVLWWQRLICRLRPDVVIANQAPFLMLAARGAIPVVTVGPGFDIPPRPSARSERSSLSEAERQILDAVSRLSTAGTRLESVGQLFHDAAPHVVSVPLLDPHSEQRGSELVGPLHVPSQEASAEPGRPEVFAYLAGASSWVTPFLLAARCLRLNATVVLNGPHPAARTLASKNLQISNRPIDTHEVLRRCGLVVHHGGFNLSQAALLVGVPHLVLPRYQEQEVTGRLLQSAGTATVLTNQSILALRCSLSEQFDSGQWAKRSREVAVKLRRKWSGGSLDAVGEVCERLAAA